MYDYGTFPDGTPRVRTGTLEGIVRRQMVDFDQTEAEAVAWLAENGWSNGYLMLALDEVAL